MSKALLSTALLAVACAAPAQTASYTYIDQRAPFQNPSPLWLTALNTPKLGQTFRFRAPNGGGNNLCRCDWDYFVLTGAKNPSAVVAIAGILFSSAEIVFQTRDSFNHGSHTTYSVTIPNQSALLGATFYQQVVSRTRRGNIILLLSLGRGGRGVIGR